MHLHDTKESALVVAHAWKTVLEFGMENGMNIKLGQSYSFTHSSFNWWRVGVLVTAILFCLKSSGQSVINLTISNSQKNKISNLTVRFTACDSTFKHDTNLNGKVSFTVKSPICKQVRIQIESKFYENLDTAITIYTPSVNHCIYLQDKAQKIKQVEVVAYRRIAKNDAQKSIYQIDTRGMLKTTKADRALSFLPGIVASNDTYTLVGQNRRCRVKVDGRNATNEELKTISARDIERVEVHEMTKDDDSGTAGEINIIKKQRQHPRAYARLSTWTGMLHPQVGTYNNFGFQNKKWDIMASFNLVCHTQKSENNITRYFSDTPTQRLTLLRTIKTRQDAEYIKLNHFATDRLTITAAAFHSGYPADATDSGSDFNGADYQRTSNEKIDHYGGYTNIGYKMNSRNTLTIKGNYYYYRYAIAYPGSDIESYRSAMREYTGELLWENRIRLFGHDHDINAGFKNVYRQNTTSSALGRHTDYSIQQLYLTEHYAFTQDLSVYAILKGETDNLRGRHDYVFLPSLRFNYNLKKGGSLSAGYQRRITRPSVDHLNADTLFINDFTQHVGNLDLQSQYNDAISMSWRRQIRNAYLTLTANYEDESHVISQIYITPDNYNATTYANIGSSKYTAVSANYSQRFCKNRMNVSLSLTGFHRSYELDGTYREQTLMQTSKGWGWTSNLNMSYLSTKGWMYMLSANYRPKSYSLNGIFHRNPQLFLTISKNLFKDRLELELNFLNSLVYCWNTRSDTYFRNMHQQSIRRLYANNITITVAWNIGKQFRGRSAASSISNDDITTKKGE